MSEANIIVEQTQTVNEQNVQVPGADNLSAETQVAHEVTLFAEPIWAFCSFTVTNSLINSWIVVLIILVLAVFIRQGLKTIPSRFQTAVETIVDGALNLADSVTGDRIKTLKIFPLAFGVFLFILLNNWLGLLPGVGSIGFIATQGHQQIFVPLLRGATADFNTTLALALMSVIGGNIFGIVAVGAWKYFNKFVNLKALASIPRKIIKEPTIIMVNPIKFFVGLIEIIGEFAKIASLSFRLFGNIFAGEVLLTSIAIMIAFIAPIPFIFLEIIIGIVQALIFSMLTLVYFSVAATAEEH